MLRDLKTKEDLAAALDCDVASLERTVAGERYRSLTIFKRGKMRTTWEPDEELKRLQRRLKIVLEAEYLPAPSAHGYIQGRSIVTNACNHLGCNFLLNFDLQNFFGSVTRKRIFDMLTQKYKILPTVAGWIADIGTWERHLPMGAPSSPVLSNMVLSPFDLRVAALSQSLKCTYTRWVDDCTISTFDTHFPSELAARAAGRIIFGPGLTHEVARLGFTFNHTKSRLADRHQGMEVTGICVRDGLSLPRRYVRKLRSQLHEWEIRGLEGASARFQERGYKRKNYAQVVFGRIQYVGAIHGYDDPLYQQLRYRYDKLNGANG